MSMAPAPAAPPLPPLRRSAPFPSLVGEFPCGREFFHPLCSHSPPHLGFRPRLPDFTLPPRAPLRLLPFPSSALPPGRLPHGPVAKRAPGRSGNRSRSSSRWQQPGLGLDLGFLLGRKPRSGDDRPDLVNWMRCFPSAEAEAEAEGKAAGSCEEEEVGGEGADHLVVMVNGLYGSSADWKIAAEFWLFEF